LKVRELLIPQSGGDLLGAGFWRMCEAGAYVQGTCAGVLLNCEFGARLWFIKRIVTKETGAGLFGCGSLANL